MIKRLRRRMTVMVIAVLILVSAGIVFAIHLSIEQNIASQAKSSLAFMAENEENGIFDREPPPSKPDGSEKRMNKNQRGNRGSPRKSATAGTPPRPASAIPIPFSWRRTVPLPPGPLNARISIPMNR